MILFLLRLLHGHSSPGFRPQIINSIFTHSTLINERIARRSGCYSAMISHDDTPSNGDTRIVIMVRRMIIRLVGEMSHCVRAGPPGEEPLRLFRLKTGGIRD